MERQFERLDMLSRSCTADERMEQADAVYEDAPLYESFSDDSGVLAPLFSIPEHSSMRFDGCDELRASTEKYGWWRTGVQHKRISSAMSVQERPVPVLPVAPSYGRVVARPVPVVRPYIESGMSA